MALALPALLVMLMLASACGAFEESPPRPTPTPTTANVIRDGGFEAGGEGWQPDIESARVDVSTEAAHAGAASLRLILEGAGGGAVRQSMQAAEFPEYVSGFFLVEEWAGDGAKGLEFVVRVSGGDLDDGYEVHELRVALGGDLAPLELPFVRYVYVDRDAPPSGEWTYFGYPVRHAFETAFGRLPGGWDGIDLVLGVRGGEGAAAVVRFDELYAGPLRFNPNRPDD